MNRKMILLPLLLAICSLVLVGSGTEREKLNAGAEDSKAPAEMVDQRETAAVVSSTLKSTEVDGAALDASASAAPNIFLDWYSVNGGGDHNVSSTSYGLGLSVGQAAAGEVSSASYNLGIGFWYGAGGVSCFITLTGDVNVTGTITSADIIYMVNFVFKGGAAPVPCDAAGDVNCNGSVTSADIIFLVNFVFKGGTAPCDGCTSALASGC